MGNIKRGVEEGNIRMFEQSPFKQAYFKSFFSEISNFQARFRSSKFFLDAEGKTEKIEI